MNRIVRDGTRKEEKDTHPKIRENGHLLCFNNLILQVGQEGIINYCQIRGWMTIFDCKVPLILDFICVSQDHTVAVWQRMGVVVVESIEERREHIDGDIGPTRLFDFTKKPSLRERPLLPFQLGIGVCICGRLCPQRLLKR